VSATAFNVNMRDIHFVLFEQLKAHERLQGIEAFSEFDLDLYKSMLDEAARVAKEILAPANAAGDQIGCKLDDDGNVIIPEAYAEPWKAMCEGGWFGAAAPQEFGGIGLPSAINIAIGEMFSGANAAFMMYPGLTIGAANLLGAYGADWMKDACLEKMYSGQWTGTMCLTEAGAGSAVGDSRTKATPTGEEGVYLLEGEKIFISCGDCNYAENVIHLVLARTPDAPKGTAGLSIFLVPKYDLRNGNERNGIYVVGLEHKMGIHGSATATLALGAKNECRGYLIGSEGQGMRIMFHMMNEARLEVGIQGQSAAAASYLNALAFAQERLQGPKLADMANPDAESVAIVNHPDVRRMLMRVRVVTETLRSFLYGVGLRLTLAEHGPEEERDRHMGNVELMTPICKALGSDLGFEATVTALQVFGGYGYCAEYPAEQYVRDCKIASIYEGTNGIQAMDLVGRKLRKGSGMLLMQWMQETGALLAAAREYFPAEIEEVQKAVQAVGACAMHIGGMAGGGRLDEAMLEASPFLELFGTTVLAVNAAEQATIAKNALEAGAEGRLQAFYEGKILNLQFFVSQFLPKAQALEHTIRSSDASCLDPVLFTEE
jgi:alkylation response protein AidB-like acyl-CoA dehydrogenase